jgi:hypothetical protein
MVRPDEPISVRSCLELDLDDAERVGEHRVLRVRLARDPCYEPLGLRPRFEPLDHVAVDVATGAGERTP